MTKSKLLYNLYKNKKLPKNVENRCCNFPLLEKNVKNIINNCHKEYKAKLDSF